MNNVVIGDLAKYDGNDALKFDYDYLIFPTTEYTSGESISADINIDSAESYNFILDTRDSAGSVYVLTNLGDWQIVGCRLFVNDEEVFSTDTVISDQWCNLRIEFINTQTVTTFLSRTTSDSKFLGQARNIITKNAEYIQNGDFGDATLIDHSGNGNDGTIVGAEWWKEGVDEAFATPQLYKSSFDVPMEDNQFVTYTDGLPVYFTSNIFWNDYNTNSTYSFDVDTQIINRVVIGDLEKLKGKNALRILEDGLILVPIDGNSDFDISLDYFAEVSTGNFDDFLISVTGSGGDEIQLRGVDSQYFLLRSYLGGVLNQTSISSHAPIDGGLYDLRLTRVGNTFTFDVDGVTNQLTEILNLNNANTKLLNPKGLGIMRTSRITVNEYSYIHYNDFGSAILTSLPAGKDGSVGGDVEWGKKGISNAYATPTDYKDSWTIPMEQAQIVTYTNGTPFYETQNVFWNDYNLNGIYKYKVIEQGKLIKKLFNELVEDENMYNVRSTIKGSTLGAGVVPMPSGDFPSYILANSDGFLRVRYPNDDISDFTDITVISDGVFYPLGGKIAEIDVDNSTVDVNDIVLGVAVK